MKERFLLAIIIAASIMSAAGTVFGAGGDMGAATDPLIDGTEDHPYLVEDFFDFEAFAHHTKYWASGVHTRMTCDLNLAYDPNMVPITYTRAVIAPYTSNSSYPYQDNPFKGIFDGDGHVISNLTIDTAGADNDYLGLFGQIDGSNAEVKNLGLENVIITGGIDSDYLGGLCGSNSGTISNCYSTGSVTGNDRLGGLCGLNWALVNSAGTVYYTGTIINCYSTGSVTGDNYLGGLCGENYSTVTNCYSTSSVNGNRHLGGLCGKNFYGTINNCFWDMQTSSMTYSDGGTGKTTLEMQTESTFTDAGWDFDPYDGDPADWYMAGYPQLIWQSIIHYNGQTSIELLENETGQIEIDVYSSIDQTLNWTITGQLGCSWITNVSPPAGTSTGPTDKTTVTIDIDASGLAPGGYTCRLLLEADNGNSATVPVLLHVYDRVDLEEFALLTQYWMADCGDDSDCIAVDFCIDGTIDTLDLYQLAISWLGEEVISITAPISHWRFDEQTGTLAADSIAGNDGTLINFPKNNSQWVDGKVDGALNFDGIDDYITVPGYKGLTGTQSRTVTAWIKTSRSNVIVYWGTPGPGGGKWTLSLNETVGWGGNTGALRVSVGGGRITGTADLRDDQWHHVAAVLVDDGSPNVSEVKLYVDGAEESITYIDEEPINTISDGDLLIGLYDEYSAIYFAGLIDELTIYDEALSQADILWLYTTSQ